MRFQNDVKRVTERHYNIPEVDENTVAYYPNKYKDQGIVIIINQRIGENEYFRTFSAYDFKNSGHEKPNKLSDDYVPKFIQELPLKSQYLIIAVWMTDKDNCYDCKNDAFLVINWKGT